MIPPRFGIKLIADPGIEKQFKVIQQLMEKAELIINCGDTIILRYYQGVVYLYDFTFRNLYYLNTDGTYSWNHTGQNFKYGMNQLIFEGTELVSKSLYRVVENTEFYIGEESVNENTLQDYINANPKTQVVFKPLTIASEWDSSNQPSYG